ncbi:unnamed protein product [Musa hybrid cultivar]
MELQKGPKSPLSSFLALLWLSLLRVEHCYLVCAVINHSCPEKKRSKEIFGPSQSLTLGLQAEVTMRKHGWQLPYHPLQVCGRHSCVCGSRVCLLCVHCLICWKEVVSICDHGALHWLCKRYHIGISLFFFLEYFSLCPSSKVIASFAITCVFPLYAWCAATDPGDPGIFRSKKYLKVEDCKEEIYPKKFRNGTSINLPCYNVLLLALLLDWYPVKYVCDWCNSPKLSPEQQMSEEGMFYCSLCEVDVLKYSKHCRACDKCVDVFDHCCRWLNNCVGRKNYKGFFVLMASALLLVSMVCSPWASLF